jgi:glucosamine-phosphate N-acetyltransferase
MIQIRECRAEDFDAVVALLRQLWPRVHLELDTLRSTFDRSLSSDRQIYLCAVPDQEVVGFGSLTTKSNLWNPAAVGYVDEMVVDGEHQGRGIGTQILDRLISWARTQGCSRVELDSAFHRKDAHAFYEGRGFQSRALLFSMSL